MYGLHQAPRAWYARLSTFLLKHNYRRGTIDKTLFIKKNSRDIILVQVYVDDIIFGSTNKAWCDEFEVLMKGELPKGFKDPHFPKHVYRVVKALYGLHQTPRAWYARLSTFLLKHNYRRGTIDKTLFIKKNYRDIILVQVYVDDIIFGSTKKAWCDEFEMSVMGELTFFLGLQVKQKPNGIFISQDKYVQDMLKKFDIESVRTATT
ncbi:putative ribonuclease H-like domain-containing protein, partial [Tanacetum coccineum]